MDATDSWYGVSGALTPAPLCFCSGLGQLGSHVVVHDIRGIHVAAVVGFFDGRNVAEVADALERAATHCAALVVSLEQCVHVDIEAVAALMLLHRRLGSGLVIACNPQRALEITGVHKIVRIEPTVEDAVRWLLGRREAAAETATTPEATTPEST